MDFHPSRFLHGRITAAILVICIQFDSGDYRISAASGVECTVAMPPSSSLLEVGWLIFALWAKPQKYTSGKACTSSGVLLGVRTTPHT